MPFNINKKIIFIIFLLSVVILGAYTFWVEAREKQDLTNIGGNLRKIYTVLNHYQEMYGEYPPQQKLGPLLEVLKYDNNAFFKVSFPWIHDTQYFSKRKISDTPVLITEFNSQVWFKKNYINKIIITKSNAETIKIKKGNNRTRKHDQ